MSYSKKSEVIIIYEQTFRAPAFTYCIPLDEAVDVTKAQSFGLCLKANESEVDESRSCYGELERHLKQVVIYENYTLDIRPYKTRYVTPTPIVMPSIRSICVKLNPTETETTIDNALSSVADVYELRMDWRQRNISVDFYIHDRRVVPRPKETYCHRMLSTKNVLLSYKLFEADHIATPNQNCIDYTTTKYESPKDCELKTASYKRYAECVRNRTFDEMECRIRENNNRPGTVYNYTREALKIRPEPNLLGLCPKECYERFYQPFLEKNPLSHGFWIKLKHLHVTTKISFTLDMVLLEYIIYVASLTSLWFGFVIFDSIRSLMTTVIIRYDRRKQLMIVPVVNNPLVYPIQQ